jgi:protein-disulfide isomerase
MLRRLTVGLVLCLGVQLGGPGAQAADSSSPAVGRQAIEEVVRNYLKAHPEVVIEAIEAFKKKQERDELADIRNAIDERWTQIQSDPGSPEGGNKAGDVTVVEFFDYRCGVCKRVHPIVADLVKSDGKIRRVYKEWPILGPESVFAARAALASRKQGKYLEFHKALMDERGELNSDRVFAVARSVGLDVARLTRDMADPEIVAILQRNFALADALRINGTPSFVIGKELLRGARDLDTMRDLVARARRPG